jgi:hypothetical protein
MLSAILSVVTARLLILAVVTAPSFILAVVTLLSAILDVTTELVARLLLSIFPLKALYITSKLAFTCEATAGVDAAKLLGFTIIPV